MHAIELCIVMEEHDEGVFDPAIVVYRNLEVPFVPQVGMVFDFAETPGDSTCCDTPMIDDVEYMVKAKKFFCFCHVSISGSRDSVYEHLLQHGWRDETE